MDYFYICIKHCGAKGSGDPGPFHIKPNVHAEEEETPEDKQREPKQIGRAHV